MISYLQVIFTATINGALLIFTSQLIPNKLNAWKIIALSFAIGVMGFIKVKFEFDTALFMLVGVLAFIAVFCIPALFYTGKLWKRYAVFITFFVIQFLSESIGYTLITVVYKDIRLIFTEMMPMLVYNGLVITIYFLFGSIAVLAWKMIAARKFQPFFLLFFILPIGQLITVMSFTFSSILILWFLGVLLSLIAYLVLLVYVISLDDKATLEDELRETRHAMDLEQSHYREVEQRREELAKIRHDFNNQIATIGQLIRSGEETAAQDMISALSNEIAETREYSYCHIPVVNAILTEKERTCAAEGIRLEVELDLPPHLSVEQLHICSIFSNLLDNAINSCKQMKDSGTPTIELKSMVDGGYLFIKAINPSSERPKKPAPGHGYGSRILSDFAARYCGDYRTDYEDGIFTAMVSLMAMEGA